MVDQYLSMQCFRQVSGIDQVKVQIAMKSEDCIVIYPSSDHVPEVMHPLFILCLQLKGNQLLVHVIGQSSSANAFYA
jgi:hypothetical protein